MKSRKVFGTILVNSATNSNQKERHLLGNLKGSLSNYIDELCLYYSNKNA